MSSVAGITILAAIAITLVVMWVMKLHLDNKPSK